MNSESEVSDDFRKKLHCTMAFIGGYIGAYALLNRADVFGNAQTSNLIHVAMSIVGTDFLDLFIRLGGVFLYMAGVTLVVIWQKITKINVHYLAVVVDALAFIMLGFFPKDMDIIVSLYPIFFAAAVQWTSFSGVYGYNCSTTLLLISTYVQVPLMPQKYFASLEMLRYILPLLLAILATKSTKCP